VAAFGVGAIVAAGSYAASFGAGNAGQRETAAPQTNNPNVAAGNPKPSTKPSAEHHQTDAAAPGIDGTKSALPQRPLRTVKAPTMTSAELDRSIGAYLVKNSPKVEPATLTTDVEFVRRIYFDVIGRPPTPDQVQSFLYDRTKEKRSRLIDSLLSTPEYARNWAKYWRDVVMFHSTNENPAQVRFELLEDWLTRQFQANTPWDEVASGLITATGRNDENGAVGFSLAHEGRPVELAGEVSRIFLGVQIQCAQCHDHKTDAWKRIQFHEFAAFFAGVKARRVVATSMGQLPVFAVSVQGPRRYFMPEKDNPAKQIPVAPRFFLSTGSKPAPPLPETAAIPERRALAASYVTGQDNPWFAKAFINRIWYALMGESFYEPIDDIGPERTPKGAEVLDPLAAQWQQGGYDIRWLFRTILNTQAYQRRVRSSASAAGKTQFASSCPSRLRADQVFDALVQALALPMESDGNTLKNAGAAKKGPGPAGKRGPALAKGALKAQARLLSLGDPKRQEGQAQTKGAAAKKAAEAIGLASQVGKKAAVVRRPGGFRLLFDRLFGIDPSTANEDVVGTIPQALFLMNSPMINNRTQARPGTVLGELLNNAPNNRAALGALYVRVLSRQPTTQEVEICGRYLATVDNRTEAFEDIYWSLINSTEFLTRR
jgi:hypothetical protein